MWSVLDPKNEPGQRPALDDQEVSLQQRAVGAYLGLAVGDALGASVEFMTPSEISQRYGVHRELIGGGWLRLKPGQVTDDTEMSLALGESILAAGGVDRLKVAESFSQWMKGKPVDIGHTVRRGIVHYRTTGEAQVPENEYDAGNGACMRCLPVALFYHDRDWQEVVDASRRQSHVTHHNRTADAGTEAILAMLIAALKGESKAQLRQLANRLVGAEQAYRFDGKRMENPSGWIIETLQAVFQALIATDNFEDLLVDVVNRGGDADTTGAIAGMLGGALYAEPAIPRRWLTALDADTRRRCTSQARALIG